jgi:asparagine synthase (glutamine-hydrolysing)
MYSLNYHRFILHLYLYALKLGELNGFAFSESLKQRLIRSIDFLYQLIDPETGQMPVYGSNDGALVLPLNNCDFADYRPLLQLGSYLTKGIRLFKSGAWDEPLYWLCGLEALRTKVEASPQTNQSYTVEGVSILRGSRSKAVIRCTDFRARPSHADQLHVDLWWRDKNIACDAGTYLYSGEGVWRNGLAHTAVHNTITVDHKDQMKMVSRFTWTNWSRGKVLKHGEKLWQGEHNGYKPVTHKRTVMALDGDRWVVVDQLQDTQPHHYALHWLLNNFPYEQQENLILLSLDSMKYKVQVGLVEGQSIFSVVRGDPKTTRGWRSRYYGDKEPAISVILEVNQPRVCFWTFFGFESDQVELAGNNLEIGFDETKVFINLQVSN